MRTALTLSLALSAAGCFTAHDDAPSDPLAADSHELAQQRCGDEGPAGGPSLGRQDCRSHVIVDEGPAIELVDSRGIRPQMDGYYYLSATGADGYGDFRLLIPGIDPRPYTNTECASLKFWAGDLFVSGAGDQPFEVTLEGNDGDSVWGTFEGSLCSFDLDDGQRVQSCVPSRGRFSARLEPDNGPAMGDASGCLEATECLDSPSMPLPAGACGTMPVCHDGRCLVQ